MADHDEGIADDLQPLIVGSGGTRCTPSYGSVVNGSTDDHESEEDEEAEEEVNQEATGTDDLQASTRSGSGNGSNTSGCWPVIKNRDSYHRRLLLLDILVIVFGIATSGVLYIELHQAYGQCIIGMQLYDGGLLTREVKRFWCRCPLYTVMLTSTIPWIKIMVNWVSDLFSKKCAFGKWLKWQAILTCCGAVGTLSATIASAFGFGRWCNQLIENVNTGELTYSEHIAAHADLTRNCFQAAKNFDSLHTDEFVKLRETFIYTLSIMILLLLLVVFWAGACYYSVRMWARLPKDMFFANMLLPPGLGPRSGRGRSGETETDEQSTQSRIRHGRIITDRMTTSDQANGSAGESHDHVA